MTEPSEKKVKSILNGKGSAIGRAVFAALLFSAFQLFAQYVFYIMGYDDKLNEGLFNFFYGVFVSVLLCYYILIIKKPGESALVSKSHMNAAQWVLVVIISFGMLTFVSLYFTLAHYLADLMPKVQESMTDYTNNIGRDIASVEETVPAWDHILYFISISFLIPITEEIAFRGIVFGELRRKFSPVASIIISGIIFGALHMQPIQIGYAVLCGIALGAIYYFCDSILATIVVHSIFNFLGSGLSQLMDSGIIPGLTDEIIKMVNDIAYSVETTMFIPGIICFIFLGLIHRHSVIEKKSMATEVVNE